MLRDAGVRTKLLAVLAIPTLLLILVTGVLVAGQLAAAREAGLMQELTRVTIQANRVVHALQEERNATLVHLQAPTSATRNDMQGRRDFTDAQIRRLNLMVGTLDIEALPDALKAAPARSFANHAEIAGARKSIDEGRFYATEADVFYSRVIRADLALPGVLATTSSEPELGRRLIAYTSVADMVEYASHERDLVQGALLAGRLYEGEYAQISAYIAQQRQSLQDFQAKAPEKFFRQLDEELATADNRTIDNIRRDMTGLLAGGEPDLGAAAEWSSAANARILAMTETETAVLTDVAVEARKIEQAERDHSLLLIGIASIGLGFALILAVALSRRITRPLRRLTVAAGEIGDELPRMVERMQTPGEGPGVTVEPINVESRDEIGRLAEAFNTVNDVTVRVAKQQAALRASIAEMFVNVARRNQVLLGRQLKALDQMEATEEDPDVLERLFALDHLATRMRRNAESLLVLAGIDSARRLRTALPLSDVIRTAVGEIESFDRIDLSMVEDPDVSGRHALSVAHLLAELLENATHFSNPETRVVVSAAPTTAGMSVSITDYGLGMSDEELAEANENIADPPIAEIAVSQRLGLFVVGRLAKRLGASAELSRGRAAGTVVTVFLPASVFEGMVVEEAPLEDAQMPAALEAGADGAAEQADAVTSAEAPDEVPAAAEHVIELEKSEQQPATHELPQRFAEQAPTESAVSDDEPARQSETALEALPTQASAVDDAPEWQPEPATHAEANADTPVVEAPVAEAPAAEAQADALDAGQPTPAGQPESVAQLFAELAVAPEPEPEPEPEAPVSRGGFPIAPAIDILPSRGRSSGGGLFRRNRGGRTQPAQPQPVTSWAPAAPNAAEPAADPVAEQPVGVDEHASPFVPDAEPDAPVFTAPVSDARTFETPTFETPVSETAVFEAPVSEAPVFEAPVVEAPVVEAPVVEAPVSETPDDVGAASSEAPVFAAAPTDAPVEASAETPAQAPAPVFAEQSAAQPDVAQPASAPFVPQQVAQEVPAAPAVPVMPARTPAQVPVGVGSATTSGGLPSRGSAVPGKTTADLAAAADLDRLAARSQMASNALSELRGLYEPSFTPSATPVAASPAGLTRRMPKAPDAPATARQQAAAPARPRTAKEVRGMLSGFRAGVERGRAPGRLDHLVADESDHNY